VTLRDLQEDLERMTAGFSDGRRLSLLIRNERANPFYTTAFMAALFEQESQGLFEVRQAILGHLQQGGDPSPFDRIQATRLAARCVDFLIDQAEQGATTAALIGIVGGRIKLTDLVDMPDLMDAEHIRPKEQWWQELQPVVQRLAQPG
ncbi:MAG TPA: 6-phosphofructokinase, partial [Anaerolineales bacterium]|nr:6-phosphofructokinase [Anaerolineales bacterium]